MKTYIPVNSDLNNYTTIGYYYVDSASNAATIANNPYTAGAFILKVEPAQASNLVNQYVISTQHGYTYFRRKTVGSTTYDTDWKFISYPFSDYTTLSGLASALGVARVSTYYMDYYNQGDPVNIFKDHFSDIYANSEIVKLVRISGNSQASAIGYNTGGYGSYLIFGYSVGCKLLTLWDNNWGEAVIVNSPH